MPPRKYARTSLATRYTLLASLVVVFTTVLLGVSSAAGVYQMAVAEQSARQQAYSEIVVRDVSGRLQASYQVILTLSERGILETGDDVQLRRALATVMVDNAEYLERIILAESSGTVVALYPSSEDVNPETVTAVIDAAAADESVFVWRPGATPMDDDVLWAVAATAEQEDGTSRHLLAQMRTQAVSTTLKQVSAADRSPTAYIVDGRGAIGFSAGDPDAIASAGEAEYVPGPEEHAGKVRLTRGDGERYVGVYADITGLSGVTWRVVILETADIAAVETGRALRPAMVAWGVSVLISVALAIGAFSWLARPLRTLEARARAAAAGAILEPIAVGRGDEVGRLLESFNLITMRLNRMHDVSQILARSSDRDEVLDGIVASMGHMLGATDVDVLLLDESGDNATLVRAIGALSGRTDLQIALNESAWLQDTLRTGDAEVFSGEAADDGLMALHRAGEGRCCGLAVPLAKGAEVLGIVAVVSERQRSFSAAEVELARSFAAQASVALDNARLFDEERRSRREAETLRDVAESLTHTQDVRDVLESSARTEADLLGMDSSFVALASPEAYGAGVAANADLEARWLREWELLHPESVPDGMHLPPVSFEIDEARGDLRGCIEAIGASTALVTPLYRGDTFAGLVVLGSKNAHLVPKRRELSVADTIGKQAGMALENAYLYEQTRTRADNLETVFRISQAVSSSLQNKVVLSRVLDVVQKIFSADAVMLMTYERDRKTIVVPMARGLLAREMLDMEFRPGADIPGRVFESKEPERIDDLEGEDTPLAVAARAQGMRSALVVPLLARGRSIGVLATLAKAPLAFSEDDMELLRTFAAQGALAIDTANLFSREHHVATVLQESILPTRLPRIPGLDASSVYVPAGSEVEIGGDYYDLFAAPDGRVVVAMGDVCGKGVEAATKTSMIKYATRGMVAAGLGPSRVLTELNSMIVESGDPAHIVTMWLGFLDVNTGVLIWANGGHPPALLLDPDTHEIERLGTTGALLGAVAAAHYLEESVILDRGAVLLLFTDGVTEARCKGRFFGEGRVRRALRSGGSAAVVTQRLISLVQRFAAGELRDDAAILTLVRLGEDAHVSQAEAPGNDTHR